MQSLQEEAIAAADPLVALFLVEAALCLAIAGGLTALLMRGNTEEKKTDEA
mgnify:CR=1 FL=1